MHGIALHGAIHMVDTAAHGKGSSLSVGHKGDSKGQLYLFNSIILISDNVNLYFIVRMINELKG